MNRMRVQWLAAVVLLGLLVISAEGAKPRPFLTVTPELFESEEESILLGTIKEVKPSGVVIDARRQVSLTLEIERTLFGPEFATKELLLPSVWYYPHGYLAASTDFGDPQVGDRVFYWHRPDDPAIEPDLFRPRVLAQASDAELARIDRFKRLIAMPDSAQAARLAIAGCVDPDPEFATWCLDLLRPTVSYYPTSRSRVYGPIQAHLSEADYKELCWKILADPSTHSRVYMFMDNRFDNEKRYVGRTERRSRCHLQRLDLIFADPGQADDDVLLGELTYLLWSGFSSMSDDLRKRSLDEVEKRILQAKNRVYRDEAIRQLCGIYRSYREDEEEYAAFCSFYRRLNPLHRPELQISVDAYCGGLDGVMRAYTGQSERLSQQGVEIFEELIVFGDAPQAKQAATQLISYANYCNSRKPVHFELRVRMRAICDTTTDVKAKEVLAAYLKKWKEEEAGNDAK
ncbi:hypothetical protein [Blastopirellula marina]|uniref:Uncharacterized protein n=1 Tax=Blastopirellula marina TaxID=124 RepID=A0A2S8GU42_9BACT|nr:hypothetical protein [Blastopirellula marina]PQO47584.1 hypothetical protein C5Y93_02680 [Blastopirellula marina]